jgi:FG-GAP repeat
MQPRVKLWGFSKLISVCGFLFAGLIAQASLGSTTLSNPRQIADHDYYGNAVALTPDGGIAVVSASGIPDNDSNIQAVYVFQFASGAWNTTPIISVCDPGFTGGGCPANSDSLADFDLFGYAIGVSQVSNGQFFMAVGAPGGANAAIVPISYGVVYIYLCTTGGTPSCALEQQLDDPEGSSTSQFGSALAISADGNTLLVGAWGAGTTDQPDEGLAYVYTTNNGDWSSVTQYTTLLTDPAPTCFTFPNQQVRCDEFGYAVALSGTGANLTALIGAPGANVCQAGSCTEAAEGQAFIFTDSGGTWPAAATFTDPNPSCNDVVYYRCDEFGTAVALSADGTKALVGAPNAVAPLAVSGEAGAAHLYMQSSSGWQGVGTPIATFTNPQTFAGFTPPLPFNSIYTGVGGFGWSLALSADGTTMIIGLPESLEGETAYMDDYGGTGQADVYTCSYSTSSATCLPGDVLVDPPALVNESLSPMDFFGTAVAISGDANVMLVGAPDTNSTGATDNGAAYVYGSTASVDVSLQFMNTPPTTAVAGTPFSYTFDLDNNGTTNATNLILTAQFTGLSPSDLVLGTVSAEISGITYSCTQATSGSTITFTCTSTGQPTLSFVFDGSNGSFSGNVGTLSGGAMDTVTVPVTANTAGNLTVSGSEQADQTNTSTNTSVSVETAITTSGGGGGGANAPSGGSGIGWLELAALGGLLLSGRRKMMKSKTV